MKPIPSFSSSSSSSSSREKGQVRRSMRMTMRRIFFATRPAILAVGLIFNFAAKAQTNGLSDAEIQGRQLARQLCEAKPVENFTNTGILKVIVAKHPTISVLKCNVEVTPTNWATIYEDTEVSFGSDIINWLRIQHFQNVSRQIYSARVIKLPGSLRLPNTALETNFDGTLSEQQITSPFAHSDFWLCDLGLEFFHWPAQKVLPHTTTLKRGREYTLLESTNPNPPTNGYSRVVSWIDRETGGILEAEAYDATGKLLKDFAPKSFKKVNGQWELQEMEIRNVQTGSRTRLEFDLPK